MTDWLAELDGGSIVLAKHLPESQIGLSCYMPAAVAAVCEREMDFQERKRLYNRCDPFEPLEPTDSRYVPIEKQPNAEDVRGDDWVAQVWQRLQLSERPVFELLTGLPGSGKSTELQRLRSLVAEPHSGGMLAVYIDAEQRLDLSSTIDMADVLATVLEQTECAVLLAEGNSIAAALEETYLSRIWNWLQSDVSITKAEVSLPAAGNLTAELRARPTLRQHVRQAIATRVSQFVGDVHRALIQLNSRAVAAGHPGGIVVICDSLEKLRGTSSNYEEVLDSCEQMFAQGAQHLRLPVHVIYTAPPALLSRAVMRDMKFFPMLKLHEPDGSPSMAGLAVARLLVKKRVPDEALGEQLGNNWAIQRDRMLYWSGGFPREIVRLLRNILQSEKPLDNAAFEKLLNRVTSEYRDLVRTSDYVWLAKVHVYHQLASDSDDDRATSDKMLLNGAVFRYLNGGDWWDVHPAVLKIDGVSAAIETLRARSTGTDG